MSWGHSWVDGVMGVGLFEDSWEQGTGTLSSNLLNGVFTKASNFAIRKNWPLHLLSCSFFLLGMQMWCHFTRRKLPVRGWWHRKRKKSLRSRWHHHCTSPNHLLPCFYVDKTNPVYTTICFLLLKLKAILLDTGLKSFMVRLPDLGNKNIRSLLKCEFQVNNEEFSV